VSLGVPCLRHLVRAVHEVTAEDPPSVFFLEEAAMHAESDLASEIRRRFKGTAGQAAVARTRARRVATPGPSSWSM